VHLGEARRRATFGAVLGGVLSALPMVWLWGFSVDDALITARVAAHIAKGFGYRFNTGGDIADAVTPLGFAFVLAPFSGRGTLAAMYFAKWLGAACGVLSAAWLGAVVATSPGTRARFAVLVPFSASVPFAAWCVSGMETGVVALLVTIALSRSRGAALSAGIAAAWRPELVPFSVVLAAGRAFAAERRAAHVVRALVLSIAPAVGVAICRKFFFGHAAPLAVWAKPSDAEHGARYLAVCLLWTGAPLMIAAPRALARLDGDSRAVSIALVFHCLAIVMVGGDWMALCRLFVPVLPAFFVLAARLASAAPAWSTLARAGSATLVSAVLLVRQGPVARGVLEQRLFLIEGARPALAGAKRIATVDSGWVGAATDADVVDLAGVTDEFVARLPGGHTSKRLPPSFVANRGVDALVLLTSGAAARDFPGASWDRAVEYRAARQAEELGFVATLELELRGTRKHYLVLRAR
jgi:hypothetical protein